MLADELLGIDITKKKKKTDAIIAEYNRLSNLGKEKEAFEFISEAYCKYLGDWRILEKYIWMLVYDPNLNHKGILAHEDELNALCELILESCPVDSLRYDALSILGGICCEKGNIEKALEYSKRFPSYYMTSGDEIERCYKRGTEEWWKQVRANIYELIDILLDKITNCALYSKQPPEGTYKNIPKSC